MNRSNVEHLVAALITQAVIWAATGSLWLGFVFVFGLFLGREHAQREYQIVGSGKRKRYEALNFWSWSKDSKFDLALPALATLLVAISVPYL